MKSLIALSLFLGLTNSQLTGSWPTMDVPCAAVPAFSAGIKWSTASQAKPIQQCSAVGQWAITYDDGPSPDTPRLLAALKANNIKATFFIVGSRLQEPNSISTLKQAYTDGHQICAHTWSHPDLTLLTADQVIAEITWGIMAIQQAIGVTPRYFRPPYGNYNGQTLQIIQAMGLIPVLWNFDSLDWSVYYTNAAQTAAQLSVVQAYSKNGKTQNTISLEHDLESMEVTMGIQIQQWALNSGANLMPVGSCLGDSKWYSNAAPVINSVSSVVQPQTTMISSVVHSQTITISSVVLSKTTMTYANPIPTTTLSPSFVPNFQKSSTISAYLSPFGLVLIIMVSLF